MRSIYTILVLVLLASSLIIFSACKEDMSVFPERDFRSDMREFVIQISEHAKNTNPDFIIIPQNGIELVSSNGDSDGPLATAYLNAIDGVGQEDLFFGYNKDDKASPTEETNYLRNYLDRALNEGKTVLTTDYCSSPSNITFSVISNTAAGYIPFAADSRELDKVPDESTAIPGINSNNINALNDAQNFLYLINPDERWDFQSAFLDAITNSNADVLIIDAFFHELWLDTGVLASLKTKPNGGTRKVIAYMSIGEAEDYRYYWNSDWTANPPIWMEAENPAWEGNYKVRYWEEAWKEIIYGTPDSYLDQIIAQGFDGVYLDIIDGFEYFEN